jgi:digeranylgeranylglycerophospholipid reductase
MKLLENNQSYDLIVVGAGPAGSSAAKTAAEKGLDVLLIEREMEIGVPDKCGEFIPSLKEMKKLVPKVPNLEEFFDPPSKCVVNYTKYVNFIFPNNVEISVPFNGVVVERKLFDKYLANEAVRAGVKIAPFTSALKLLDKRNGLRVRNNDGLFDLYSNIIVGADGAYSLIAREAGLPVSKDPLDYGVGYQYEMCGVKHDPDFVDMYLGEDIAPGTYAWIIPKEGDIANVGTGVRAPFMDKSMSIRDYQYNFVNKHPISSKKLIKAMPTAVKAGNIPVGGPLMKTSTEKVMVVGDAGGHTIPTVGWGIPPGLIVGRIAGNIASEHILNGRCLTDFDYAWRNEIGETLENSLRLRRMSDVVFKNKMMIDVVTRLGWLTKETIMKFILCKMDMSMKFIEKTLMRKEQAISI